VVASAAPRTLRTVADVIGAVAGFDDEPEGARGPVRVGPVGHGALQGADGAGEVAALSQPVADDSSDVAGRAGDGLAGGAVSDLDPGWHDDSVSFWSHADNLVARALRGLASALFK
jgi:hypothetical protein